MKFPIPFFPSSILVSIPSYFLFTPSSSIVLSLQFDIANNLGNLWLSGKSPTHLSSQNLIVLLVPTIQSMLLLNNLFCCPSPYTLRKSLHHHDSSFTTLVELRFLHDPYFDSNTSFHNPFPPLISISVD